MSENPYKKKRLPQYPQPSKYYAWNEGYNQAIEDVENILREEMRTNHEFTRVMKRIALRKPSQEVE